MDDKEQPVTETVLAQTQRIKLVGCSCLFACLYFEQMSAEFTYGLCHCDYQICCVVYVISFHLLSFTLSNLRLDVMSLLIDCAFNSRKCKMCTHVV